MRSRAHAFALAALVALAGSGPLAPFVARADGPAAPAGSGGSTATVTVTPMADSAAAPPASASASAPDAPSPSASAAPTPPTAGSQATGFGWSTPKAGKHGKTGAHASVAHKPPGPATEGPGAVVPGFEMLGDGSTRLFVQMPRPVVFTSRVGPNAITYVLKNVQVDKRNNYNPLVTVHFNTPVASARLVPHGRDLWLVVALRAKVQPSAALEAAKDGGAVLQIDFPKGDYLPAAPATSDAPSAPATAAGGAPGH